MARTTYSTEAMTLNLPMREMRALEKLADHHGMSKVAVLRQAMRLYQLVHQRMQAGETLTFSGDQERAALFIGIGLGEPNDD